MSASPHPYSSLIFGFSNFPILEQLKWFMIYLSRLSQHQSTDLGHEMFVSPGGRTAGPLQRMSCRQAATGRAECCEQLRAVRYPHHSGGACVHSPQSGAGARQRRSCVDMMWQCDMDNTAILLVFQIWLACFINRQRGVYQYWLVIYLILTCTVIHYSDSKWGKNLNQYHNGNGEFILYISCQSNVCHSLFPV